MSRNNYYRSSQRGRGEGRGPSWGNNSNYRNSREGSYTQNQQDDYDDQEERAYYGYNRHTSEPQNSEYYGGNNYGERSYGNYGTGYGGGTLRNKQNDYNDNYKRDNDTYARRNSYERSNEDRGFIDRAGDRTERGGEGFHDRRDDWREHQQDDRNYGGYHDHNYSSRHRNNDRNFIEKAAHKVREKWNDWTGRDSYDGNGDQRYENNWSENRSRHTWDDQYPETGFNRGRGYYEDPPRNSRDAESDFRRREQGEWSY